MKHLMYRESRINTWVLAFITAMGIFFLMWLVPVPSTGSPQGPIEQEYEALMTVSRQTAEAQMTAGVSEWKSKTLYCSQLFIALMSGTPPPTGHPVPSATP